MHVLGLPTEHNTTNARFLIRHAGEDQQAAVLRPLGGRVPRLIHHMHRTYDALTSSQKMFYERCKVMHPHWWVQQGTALSALPVQYPMMAIIGTHPWV